MEITFFNASGTALFVRDDMEDGHWTQQEMNVTATFPFDHGKEIKDGMRIAFRDPATNDVELFEIKVVRNIEPSHSQEITAEHIAVSELTDEHINSQKVTGQTAGQALGTVLTGTLWSVGTDTSTGTQDADFARGSVWSAVGVIQKNWNVYITPRVVITSGVITGRYLDIAPAVGVWRGLRLSIRKNLLDPCVTYDEDGLYTALYGYGGSVEKPRSGQDDEPEVLTFADEVWTATAGHPAKPSGQTYLEWPEKTALYGRNGRPRFGYFQNGSIKDASILLEKTWESLQQCSKPKVTIAGGCTDLYRLGYKDQPLRLHDQAIIEVEETGELLYLQIVCCDIDLLDATGNQVEIGDYIPNIVYINRETAKKAGGGGGGGSPGSDDNEEADQLRFETEFIRTQQMIGMVAGIKNGDVYVKAASIVAAINNDGSSQVSINADKIYINGSTKLSDLMTGQAEVIDMKIYDAEIRALQITSSFKVGNYNVGWKDITVVTGVGVTLPSITRSSSHYFLYGTSSGSTTPTGASGGRLITAYTDGSVSPTTQQIYYLGRLST